MDAIESMGSGGGRRAVGFFAPTSLAVRPVTHNLIFRGMLQLLPRHGLLPRHLIGARPSVWPPIFFIYIFVLDLHGSVMCAHVTLHIHACGHDRHMVLSSSQTWTTLHGSGCEKHDRSSACNATTVRHAADLFLASQSSPVKWGDIQYITITCNNLKLPMKFMAAYHAALPAALTFTPEHHLLHAAYAFYTSPFTSPLVVSIDGSGTFGDSFVVYTGSWKTGLQQIHECSNCRLGLLHYTSKIPGTRLTEAFAQAAPDHHYYQQLLKAIKVTTGWGGKAGEPLQKLIKKHPSGSASRQSAVQQALHWTVWNELKPLAHARRGTIDGLVLAGGVAQNQVLATYLSTSLSLKVWTPAHSGDGTLGFGALWLTNPPASRAVVQFAGPGLPAIPPKCLQGILDGNCTGFAVATLQELLQARAVVQVVAGRDHIGGSLGSTKPIHVPGHRSLVSCYPLNVPMQQVMVSTEHLRKMFVSDLLLEAPSHSLYLEMQVPIRQQLGLTLRHACVAAVVPGQDTIVDDLLRGTGRCPFPMLFTAAIETPLAQQREFNKSSSTGWGRLLLMPNATHVWWREQLCTVK